MPFNKAFREKQKAAKENTKKNNSGRAMGGTERRARDDDDPQFPEQDVHCKGMTFHGKGKIDKYGNYTRG